MELELTATVLPFHLRVEEFAFQPVLTLERRRKDKVEIRNLEAQLEPDFELKTSSSDVVLQTFHRSSLKSFLFHVAVNFMA